ncbi:hypothetical protein SKAU_G00104720 [Synaphobranchus kaupii]|uniref:Uncharacterized protein n=1 Tax=Synaphobranchus kaupii TaxID=118154 RepID=A0A9Q1J7G4_SYNKA|nr:hypothetical protein SKAU_G00104720 [Synaphobranchus kaupii]
MLDHRKLPSTTALASTPSCGCFTRRAQEIMSVQFCGPGRVVTRLSLSQFRQSFYLCPVRARNERSACLSDDAPSPCPSRRRAATDDLSAPVAGAVAVCGVALLMLQPVSSIYRSALRSSGRTASRPH